MNYQEMPKVVVQYPHSQPSLPRGSWDTQVWLQQKLLRFARNPAFGIACSMQLGHVTVTSVSAIEFGTFNDGVNNVVDEGDPLTLDEFHWITSMAPPIVWLAALNIKPTAHGRRVFGCLNN